MELFLWSTAAYWVGVLTARLLYRIRVQNLTYAHQAVMDSIFDQVENPANLLPFCSDALVRGVYATKNPESPLFRAADREMRRRGITLPPPGPPMRSVETHPDRKEM